MDPHLESSKITAYHLARNVAVYIRQSSNYQVLNNTASTAQQYDMAKLAAKYGWPADKIIIIDKDQGLSGASIDKREGFKEMVAETMRGHVGAIFALEASRLARDDFDWQQLVRLCAYTNTLIVDESGIYAAQGINDKILLDIKGLFATIERFILKSRLNGGRLTRAKEGKLRFLLPPGYVYSPAGEILLDPDGTVQELVRLFFDQFEALGSALGVARYFRDHKINFPTRVYDRRFHVEYRMMPLTHGRALKLIHNPTYAGMYVYGRRQRVPKAILDGDRVFLKTQIVEPSPAEWTVTIRNSHEGYITEEQFNQNLSRLETNRFKKDLEGVGAPRSGSALLQGIVRCGVCGGKMYVRYQGKNSSPTYKCFGSAKLDRSGKCTLAAGDRVDPAVSELLLQALIPAQVEASFGTLEQIEAELRRTLDLGKARVKDVETQAEQAKLLYKRAAKENTHVRLELEHEWNTMIRELERAKQDLEALRASSRQGLQPEEKESLLALISELPTLWAASTTSQQDRKALIRLLIKDVLLIRKPGVIKATIRWQDGGRHEFEVPWPNHPDSHTTDPAIIDLIRRLTPTHTDKQIAEYLNKEGIRPRHAKQFSQQQVFALREGYNIRGGNSTKQPDFIGQREDGRYSAKAIAEMFEVPISYVYKWCRSGELDASQSTPNSKLWVRITSEDATRLKQSLYCGTPRTGGSSLQL
jgi:DNA invertase Pin-like site-specific DNA recombinase